MLRGNNWSCFSLLFRIRNIFYKTKNPAQLGRIFSFFDIVQDIVLVIFVYFVMSNISSNVFFLSKSQRRLFQQATVGECQISLLMSSF